MHGSHGKPFSEQHAHEAGMGHNAASEATQWQTPHLSHDHHHPHEDARADHARDMDLVEAAFCEGFAAASDPTSFLRLAGIPFEGEAPDGTRLVLLRVMQNATTDVGNVTPYLGGAGFRYAPLPAKLTSSRKALTFAYFDGTDIRTLSLEQAKALLQVAG